MKYVMYVFTTAFLALLVTVGIMTVSQKSDRESELSEITDEAVLETLTAVNSSTEKWDVDTISNYFKDTLDRKVTKPTDDDNWSLTSDVKYVTTDGILAVETSETFTYPTGLKGESTYKTTGIIDKSRMSGLSSFVYNYSDAEVSESLDSKKKSGEKAITPLNKNIATFKQGFGKIGVPNVPNHSYMHESGVIIEKGITNYIVTSSTSKNFVKDQVLTPAQLKNLTNNEENVKVEFEAVSSIVNITGTNGNDANAEQTMVLTSGVSYFDSGWLATSKIPGYYISNLNLSYRTNGHGSSYDQFAVFGKTSSGKVVLLYDFGKTTNLGKQVTIPDVITPAQMMANNYKLNVGSFYLSNGNLGNSQNYNGNFNASDDIRQIRVLLASDHGAGCFSNAKINYSIKYGFDFDLYKKEK